MQNLPLDVKHYYLFSEEIDSFYTEPLLSLPQVDRNGEDIYHVINGYALFQDLADPKHAAIARYVGNHRWTVLSKKKSKFENIMPKDLYQSVFFDSLSNKDTLLSVGIGPAGTGKTTIALAYAFSEYMANEKSIVLVKPTTMVGAGKAFGPVPGDISEKYAPYLTSYEIVLKKVAGRNSKDYLEQMKAKEKLQFFPLELARGCTFENCTLILDESQNVNWHELNTLISRMGDNSKMILLGDLNQIDTGIPYHKTGLYKMLSSYPFQDSKIASAIELKIQYRSPITELATEINKWISHNG